MRCFTILGPSQSGKSTLLKAMSELDGRPVVNDFTDFLSLRTFSYLGEDWAGIDVAGGTEYLGYAGRALAASDAAVLCVPPEPDEAVMAAPYLRLIEESEVPCFLFINRMDATSHRAQEIVAALQSYARHPIVLRQIPIREGGQVVGTVDLISERAWQFQENRPSALIEMPSQARDREQEARTDLLEHLADFDDALLEQLIEDKTPAPENIYSVVAEVHRQNEIVTAFLGAAEHMNGVNRLMKSLRHEAPGVEEVAGRLGLGPDARAIGVFADNRRHVGKSVLLRALGEGVAQGATLGGAAVGNLTRPDGKSAAEKVGPGELALAVKSDHLDPGRAFSAGGATDMAAWTRGNRPAFRRILLPESERDEARLSGALARLAAIDPGLELSNDEESGHVVAALQGPMHLRRLMAQLDEDFGIKVSDGPVGASYRETISKPVEQHYRHRKQSGGAGQFADVQLTVRPLPRGEGFSFDETVKGGAVPRNYIPAVEAGAKDALEEGPLGFPVVDVSVTLTDGKHHSVDSSDYAFRTAGKMGVREALRAGSPVLLQPIERVAIHLPSAYSGSLVALISSLKGQVLGFDPNPDARGWDIFRALIPASARDELFQALGGMTHGTAWFESELDHYEELRGKEAERVRQERQEAVA